MDLNPSFFFTLCEINVQHLKLYTVYSIFCQNCCSNENYSVLFVILTALTFGGHSFLAQVPNSDRGMHIGQNRLALSRIHAPEQF